MYLESVRAQRVWVGALGRELTFGDRERIHTETCAKYDQPRIERILHRAGFARAQTYVDGAGLFAVHLARLVAAGQ